MATVAGTSIVIVRQSASQVVVRGQTIGPETTVRTGEDGTLMLIRHGSSIMVYPNSEVTIPEAAGGDHGDIEQRSGESLYRIKAHETLSFEVRTPYLSATVEGTVFVVAVTADYATVSVAAGMVRVLPARGGNSDIVHAGHRASVVAASADRMTLESVDFGDTTVWSAGQPYGEPAPGQPGNVGSPAGTPGVGGSTPGEAGAAGSPGAAPGGNGPGSGNSGGGGPAGGGPGGKGSGGGDSNNNGPGGGGAGNSGSSKGGDPPGGPR